MPQLLVSVRNSQEAIIAASCGVEIIDLKEPSAGALGPVTPGLRDEIARQLQALSHCGNPVSLSVALGELCDCFQQKQEADELSCLQAFRFAKIGLAGARSLPNWQSDWLSVIQWLPAGTIPVAAAYADAAIADAPEPEHVLAFALEQSLSVFLLDTWSKSQGSVFDVFSAQRLDKLRQQAAGRVSFALAGSLNLECEPRLRQLQPDIVALRGAVCVAGRTSQLSSERVKLWKTLVSQLADNKSTSLN